MIFLTQHIGHYADEMDLTELKKTNKYVTVDNAYEGFQTIIDGKTAIISFWDVLYKRNGISKSHRETRMCQKRR